LALQPVMASVDATESPMVAPRVEASFIVPVVPVPGAAGAVVPGVLPALGAVVTPVPVEVAVSARGTGVGLVVIAPPSPDRLLPDSGEVVVCAYALPNNSGMLTVITVANIFVFIVTSV